MRAYYVVQVKTIFNGFMYLRRNGSIIKFYSLEEAMEATSGFRDPVITKI